MTATLCLTARADDAKPKPRVYVNRLTRIANPPPLLADFPRFVQPVKEVVRYEAPMLIDENEADLSVRAWRFSYNARGIVEVPNRIRGDRTALIVVHPWGIDDGQGWNTPQPAGAAFQCTPVKNAVYRRHVQRVVNPLVQALRKRVKLVACSLPGKEDPIRKKLYRSVRGTTTSRRRREGQAELERKLKSFRYRAGTLPARISLSGKRPVTEEYFRQFSGLDASARFNADGFWKLPIPVVRDLNVALNDVVIYDAEGYDALKRFLQAQGVRHVLLCGYNTDMCVCSTTAGYENLRKDFNVFLIGDATLATFPANSKPAYATNAAVSFASLKLFITQVSWIKPAGKK
ncbi:MAG: isochorismatase family protein [Planctomycetaceae bacterium]